MPNELRVRQNFVGGLVEDNPLTAAATTLTSAALAAVPVIGTTQHYPIVLDPDGIGGEPEIVWVTAHVAGATTATILRAQEGTAARQHNRDLPWLHGPTTRDVTGETAWTDLPLAAGWARYSATLPPPQFRKDAGGWVHLRGLAVTTNAADSVMGTLPVGYRPGSGANEIFTSWCSAAVRYLQVLPSGAVHSGASSADAYVSLAGLTFLAEQ